MAGRASDVSEIAQNIARHADESALRAEGTHYIANVSIENVPAYIDDVLEGRVPGVTPGSDNVRYLERGRVAYWDPDKQVIIIEDGEMGGTYFSPLNGRKAFDDLQ